MALEDEQIIKWAAKFRTFRPFSFLKLILVSVIQRFRVRILTNINTQTNVFQLMVKASSFNAFQFLSFRTTYV